MAPYVGFNSHGCWTPAPLVQDGGRRGKWDGIWRSEWRRTAAASSPASAGLVTWVTSRFVARDIIRALAIKAGGVQESGARFIIVALFHLLPAAAPPGGSHRLSSNMPCTSSILRKYSSNGRPLSLCCDGGPFQLAFSFLFFSFLIFTFSFFFIFTFYSARNSLRYEE